MTMMMMMIMMMTMTMTMLRKKSMSLSTTIMVVGLLFVTLAEATTIVPCVRTVDCENQLTAGSVCLGGTCTNPFYERGCLATLQNDNNQQRIYRQLVRTCTSADPPQAVELGFCRPPSAELDYAEIRIYTQNWESVFMEAWMLQILLTEVLGVPVTLETGVPDVQMDFYDPEFKFGYGSGNDYTGLETSVNLVDNGDCTQANGINVNTTTYTPCFHFAPEVWTTQMNRLQKLKNDGIIEQPEGLGVVGQMNWWIPRYTAMRDPTLLTYFGLQHQRHKLADIFKRPTTWGDYCTQVSLTACQVPDGVAARAPLSDAEAAQYFDAVHYTGHFRKTDENDCETYPDTCTGHIADFPCGWSSFVEQQTWHLNISLRSSGNEPGCRGYTYGELLGIFAAANATKSDIIFQWWTPDIVHNMYSGTDAEFQAVGMPLPTLECIENTITSVERCDEDASVRRGSAEGACGEPPYPLQKAYSSVLFDITKGDTIPEAQQSPAYDLLKAFSLTSLQLGDFYDRWLARDSFIGFDLRHATCQWMVDHWDLMETFIPRDFPRVPVENIQEFDDPLFLAAVILASLAGTAVIVTALGVQARRDQPVIKNAQIGFLWILLAGLFLIATGSVFSFLPPSMGTCTLTSWLVNLGYTMELIPLIVKVAAIQKLMQAARAMRRVSLNLRDLYVMVCGICCVVVVFQGLWTVLDTPDKAYHSSLSSEKTDRGETIILMTPYCKSDSNTWRYLTVLWHGILLIAAALLAFQTRKLKTDFGETETLGIMVYSHFVFVALRLLTYTVQDEESEANAALYRSLIYSSNILSSIGIYFIPKFLHKEGDKGLFDLRTNASIPASMRQSFNNQATATGLSNNIRGFDPCNPNATPSLGWGSGTGSHRFSKPPISSILEVGDEESSEEISAGDKEAQTPAPQHNSQEQWKTTKLQPDTITNNSTASVEELSDRLNSRLHRMRNGGGSDSSAGSRPTR